MSAGADSGRDAERSAPKPHAMESGRALEPLVHGCAKLTPELREILETFHGGPLRATFLGVGVKIHYFLRTDDFHVSQLSLGHQDAQPDNTTPALRLKLSDGLCAMLLESALGPRPGAFSLKKLSPLETVLLNELSRELLNRFYKSLIRTHWTANPSETVCRLTWAVSSDSPADRSPSSGKILLEAPHDLLRSGKQTGEPWPVVPDAFFFHARSLVRIALGSARIALSDLNSLEPGDLVVLEESNIGTMYLTTLNSPERIRFSPIFRQRGNITLPDPREFTMTDLQSSTRQTLWDNLMIEVSAELDPVQLPLKQLKEMTEGLVVEMGDLVNNRVSLHVGGKTLAWGELVIVGDKFGVRVSKLADEALEADREPASHVAAEAAPPADSLPMEATSNIAYEESPPAPSEESIAEDFLNQDFDTFDEDEEEW